LTALAIIAHAMSSGSGAALDGISIFRQLLKSFQLTGKRRLLLGMK
jgi:hypothetical protein